MKCYLGIFVFIVAVACLPLQALTIDIPNPSVEISVDGTQVDSSQFTISYDREAKQGHIDGKLQTSSWALDISVTTNPDPFVLYALGVVNNTNAPLAFSFTFLTPLLLGPYDQITNSFNGSMTDLIGNGVSLSGILQLALLNGGNVPAVQLGTFACAGGPGAPLTNYACPPGPGFGPITAAVPNAFYNTLGANLNFTISPADSASFNGGVILDSLPIPEPTTMLLLSAGLGVMGLGAWRRMK